MRMLRYALLALVPLAPVLHYTLGLPALWVFAAGILGVGVLAEWIRVATEQLALRTGPAIGGLLTISLGSLAELILALFVLAGGETEVLCQEDARASCCTRDEGGPFGAVL